MSLEILPSDPITDGQIAEIISLVGHAIPDWLTLSELYRLEGDRDRVGKMFSEFVERFVHPNYRPPSRNIKRSPATIRDTERKRMILGLVAALIVHIPVDRLTHESGQKIASSGKAFKRAFRQFLDFTLRC